MRSILYYIISKIKKLQNKDTEIDTEISGIKQDITDINGDITTINGDITDIKPRLTTAENNIETIQNNISTINVTTITDLNTGYTRTGSFFFNNANAPDNRPTGSQAGYLEVLARSDNDILQRYTNYDNNNTYVRQKRGGTWNTWTQL